MFRALKSLTPAVALVAYVSLLAPAHALLDHGLSHEQLALVRQRLKDGAHATWELGTAAQAVLELDYPDVSVYGASPFPPPYALNESAYPIQVAQNIGNSHPVGLMALIDDGSSGDPASNGISMMLANWTFPNDPSYLQLMQDQLYFLEHDVPHTGDGAYSHRANEVQLWADSVYMVPPVLACWGALHPGTDIEWTYLHEAYNQIRLYREYLRDPSAGNKWQHIVLGGWSDTGHWATGQGWAGAGMLRVYQTIAKSTLRDQMGWALSDLAAWTEEIVAATWAHQQADGSLNNYLGRDGSFKDMSATALMAAVTYRLGLITDISAYMSNADRAFALVKNSIDNEGWLFPVVDPYGFTNPGARSPEGQAFVLMLQAAYRDFQSFGKVLSGSLSDLFSAFADAVEAAKNENGDAQQ